jgi:SAM-dependent methyltransferase
MRIPKDLNATEWLARWERMQEHYLVRRSERLQELAWLVAATQASPRLVLDLGCGTGSVMDAVLEALPETRVIGVDLDAALLVLARARLARFGARAELLEADLRDGSWWEGLATPVDAAVSATALHWLGPEELQALYGRLARALRPGGLFASADHAASGNAGLQREWERRREELRQTTRPAGAEDWDAFWAAYGETLGIADVRAYRMTLVPDWHGVESGLPLLWHLDALRRSGFATVECFQRYDCDAIYGGLR